jgi:hypothetical protein
VSLGRGPAGWRWNRGVPKLEPIRNLA